MNSTMRFRASVKKYYNSVKNSGLLVISLQNSYKLKPEAKRYFDKQISNFSKITFKKVHYFHITFYDLLRDTS